MDKKTTLTTWNKMLALRIIQSAKIAYLANPHLNLSYNMQKQHFFYIL